MTDIKREVEQAQQELKTCKQEQNSANFEYQQLKKENQQLNATLKRYRKLLQDLTNESSQRPLGLNRNRLNGSMISESDTHKITRKDSNSSFISLTTNQHGNILDANRIEKLLSVFTQLSHCKKVKDMIKLLLDEMKNLVTFAKCTVFVFPADLREQCDRYTD